jgi:hypothetical protein
MEHRPSWNLAEFSVPLSDSITPFSRSKQMPSNEAS